MASARPSLSIAIFSAVALATLGTSAQATIARGVPAGFEDLAMGQTEQVEINLLGKSLGLHAVHVTPTALRFLDVDAVVRKMGLDETTSGELIGQITHAMQGDLPRGGQRQKFDPSGSTTAQYLETDTAAVMFDESQGTVMLFLSRLWVTQIPLLEVAQEGAYHHVTPSAENALIHHQSVQWAGSGDGRQSLSARGMGALGITERGYVGGEWSFDMAAQRRNTQQSIHVDNLYFRQDIGDKHYSQLGRLDQRNLASSRGGSFGFNLLPLPRFEGARVGTTQAYRNADVEQNATPVTLLLTSPARVEIFRENQLLGTQYLQAGVQKLDTRTLPEGSYALRLRIFENGNLTRTEHVSFAKTDGDVGNLDTQWFLQGGRIVENGRGAHSLTGHAVQAGFKTGLFNEVLLTSGVSGLAGQVYSETRLDWQKALFNGTFSASASYLTGTDGSQGNTQSISYLNGIGASLNRSQTRSAKTGSNRTASLRRGDSDSLSASIYAPLGNWSLSAGMNYNKSKGRPFFGGTFDDDGRPFEDDSWRHRRRASDNVSRAIQIQAARSFSWKGAQFSTSFGAYQRVSTHSYRERDRGIFANLSISRSSPSSDGGRSSSTSARVDMRNSRNGAAEVNYGASQSWAWRDGLERDVSVDVNGYRAERFYGQVRGQVAGRAGQLVGGVSHGYDTSTKKHNNSMSGGYTSSFAVGRSGFYWGDAGSGEVGAVMAVKVATPDSDEQSTDDTTPLTEISGGSGRNVKLGFGQRALLSMAAYEPVQTEIRDATSAASQGMANLTKGAGRKRYFMTPGKMMTHEITAILSYTYLGRAISQNGTPLAHAKALNLPGIELDEEGGFVLDANVRMQTLYLLHADGVMQCPMLVQGKRDVVQYVGETTCQPINKTALPESLRQQSRVRRLLAIEADKVPVPPRQVAAGSRFEGRNENNES